MQTSNTFTVSHVCLLPADNEQPIVRVFPTVSFLRHVCADTHECMPAPYCNQVGGDVSSIFDFCAALPGSSRRSAYALRSQAAHAFSAVLEAPSDEMYPMPHAVHIGRAGIVGHTGNVAHDLFLNGGMLDLFAESFLRRELFDVLLLDAGNRFGSLLASQRHVWQLQVLEALFNETSAKGPRLLPLRVRQPLCIDELSWKPPALDYNPYSRTLLAMREARRRVLSRLRLAGHSRQNRRLERSQRRNDGEASTASDDGKGKGGPRVVLYTRADADRRALEISDARRLQASLGITSIVQRMPTSPWEQLALFATADVFIAPHGASSANAFVMAPGSTYLEISPLCLEICLEGCYPYSWAGSDCKAHAVADKLFNGRAKAACAEVLRTHAGFSSVHAHQAGVKVRSLFACVGGNRCHNGSILSGGPDDGKRAIDDRKAWKYNYHERIVLSARLEDALADELRLARESPSPPSPPFTCPSLAPRHSAGAIDMKLVWENGLPTRGRSARAAAALSDSAQRQLPSVPRALLHASPNASFWVANAAMGYCGVTEDAGDCMRGDAGSVSLDEMEVANWEVAIHVCRKLLRRCPRATFATVSLVHKDCSWYHRCDRLGGGANGGGLQLPQAELVRSAAQRGLALTDFRSGRLWRRSVGLSSASRHDWSSIGSAGLPLPFDRCDADAGCPFYGSSSCMCASGKLRSDSALRLCLPSPLCEGHAKEAVAAPPLLAQRTRLPTVSRRAKPQHQRASLLLFLVFQRRYVRPAYIGDEEAAYNREWQRAVQLLLSLRDHARTNLPVHVVVGGERRFRKERLLTMLGAKLLPIAAPVRPPEWASDYYRCVHVPVTS